MRIKADTLYLTGAIVMLVSGTFIAWQVGSLMAGVIMFTTALAAKGR